MFRSPHFAARPELIHIDYLRRRLGPAVQTTKAAERPLVFLRSHLPDWVIQRLLKLDWTQIELPLALAIIDRLERLGSIRMMRKDSADIRSIGGDELQQRLVIAFFSTLRLNPSYQPILHLARVNLRETSSTWLVHDSSRRQSEFSWLCDFAAIKQLIRQTALEDGVNIDAIDVSAILYTHDRFLHWLSFHGSVDPEWDSHLESMTPRVDELAARRLPPLKKSDTEPKPQGVGSCGRRFEYVPGTRALPERLPSRASNIDARPRPSTDIPADAGSCARASANPAASDAIRTTPANPSASFEKAPEKSKRGRRPVELPYEIAQVIWWDISDDIAPAAPTQKELCDRLTEHGFPMSDRTFRNRKNAWEREGRKWPPSRPQDEDCNRQEFLAA